MENLANYLSKIPNNRRLAGQRHNQVFVLLLVIMSTMSGYYGYRAIGDFIKRNRRGLLHYFKPHKDRLPSFDTVRRVLMSIDFDSFSEQFKQWALSHAQLSEKDWISIDGKVISGTVRNAVDINQSYISIVSVYCTNLKMVIANDQVKHPQENELGIVQELITTLGLEGVTFSLDAYHCQKKQPKSSLNTDVTI